MNKVSTFSNKTAFVIAGLVFLLTYGGRWASAALHNAEARDRVVSAQTDQNAARQALTEFRKKPQRRAKSKVDAAALIAAFQLPSSTLKQLNKTIDALPFLMDCGAADVWLDSRLAFHESEAIAFPEGADTKALEIERQIESQILGLDIGLEKDCSEFPCMFTMHTETIPLNLLIQFHDEMAMSYSTLIFETPTCENCAEQFLSFGAAEDPIPDEAFRRMRWRKRHGGSR